MDPDSQALFDLCILIGLCTSPAPAEPTTTATDNNIVAPQTTTPNPTKRPTLSPTISPQPTTVPTYQTPPDFGNVCEFLGNCPPGYVATPRPTPRPTNRPTRRPTPSPVVTTTTAPVATSEQDNGTNNNENNNDLESNQAVDFLCSFLGICFNDDNETTTSTTSTTNEIGSDTAPSVPETTQVAATPVPSFSPTNLPPTTTSTTTATSSSSTNSPTTAPTQERPVTSFLCRIAGICL